MCKGERFFLSTCAQDGVDTLIHDNLVWHDRVNRKRWIDLDKIGQKLRHLRADQKDTYRVVRLDWDNTEHIQFGAMVFLRKRVEGQKWKELLIAQRRGVKVYEGQETMTMTSRCIPDNLFNSKEFYGWPAVGNGLGGLLAYLNGEYSNKAFRGVLKLEQEFDNDMSLFFSFVDWLEANFDTDYSLPKMAQYKALEPFLKKLCDFPPGMIYRDDKETAAGMFLTYGNIYDVKEQRGSISMEIVREWQQVVANDAHGVVVANLDLFNGLYFDEDMSIDMWLNKGCAETAGMAIMDCMGKTCEGRFLVGTMIAKGKPITYLLFFGVNEQGTICCIFNPQESKTADTLALSCLRKAVQEYSILAGRVPANFTLLNHTSKGVCDQTNIPTDAEALAMMTLFYVTMCPTKPPPVLADLGMNVESLRMDIAMCLQACSTSNMLKVSYDREGKLMFHGKTVRNEMMSPEKKAVKAAMEKSFRD